MEIELSTHAPSVRAMSSAARDNGRTAAALPAACSLAAVPSRTRPAIPCAMQAPRYS